MIDRDELRFKVRGLIKRLLDKHPQDRDKVGKAINDLDWSEPIDKLLKNIETRVILLLPEDVGFVVANRIRNLILN